MYESIRKEVLEAQRRERAANEAAVYAALDAKLALIGQRRAAADEAGED